MDYAMNYEYLLRRIYKVGRYGKANVDADVYRKLQHAEAVYRQDLENIENNTPRVSNQKIEDLLYNYQVECRRIWSILSTAIRQGNRTYFGVLSSSEIKTLEDLIVEPKNITIKDIENLIAAAEEIYVKHEIYPA